MELNERETLIKVEQQLQDSVKNQEAILRDIKEFFNRIETESKFIASTNAELKSYKEASAIRWTELEKKLATLQKVNEDNSLAINKLFDLSAKEKEERINAINVEKTERKEAITTEHQDRTETVDEEKEARKLFQESITSSFTTTKVIFTIIGSAIALIVGIFEIARHIKGN